VASNFLRLAQPLLQRWQIEIASEGHGQFEPAVAFRRLRFLLNVSLKMRLNSTSAQLLLLKCVGDQIWDEQTCIDQGIPQIWFDELVENYESGFDNDRNTIYVNEHVVNQYRGVSDLHIALKLAEFLGIDWKRATSVAPGRRAQVEAIKAELDEL